MNPLWILRSLLTSKVPIYMHYGITHRCSLHCRMCGIWRYGDIKEELNMDQISQIGVRLKKIGVHVIAIGGGEPTDRADIIECVKVLAQYGFEIRLLTSGVFHDDDLATKLVKAGLGGVSISLDCLSPEKQDWICNSKGVWERIITSMIQFSRALPQNKIKIMNIVVSKLNINELGDLARFAEALGYFASFCPVELEDNAVNRFVENAEDFGFSNEDHNQIIASFTDLIRMKKNGRPILNSTRFLRLSADYLCGKGVSWPCKAGGLFGSIAPNGDYSICYRGKKLGNMLDPEFQKYFGSDSFHQDRMSEIKNCSGCMRPCWSELSLAFSHFDSFLEMIKVRTLRHAKPMIADLNDAIQWIKNQGIDQ